MIENLWLNLMSIKKGGNYDKGRINFKGGK